MNYHQYLERLGANMRLRRSRVGFSQQHLADELGMNIGTISRWESGQREVSLFHLEQYATAIGCCAADLLPRRTNGRH